MSLISIKNLTFCYDGSFDNIFENVTLQLDTDWKLGMTGRNGRGKTTLLKLLSGSLSPNSGTISASVQMIYFPYEVEDKRLLTTEVISRILPEFEEWELLFELSLLSVSREVLSRPYDTLSGGEQTKVLLAVLFLKDNSFLLIDEPTNHLDRQAREIVSNYLRSKKGFLLVSHDRAFLDNCIDHVLAINKTDLTLQSGSFSSWWQEKEQKDRFETEQNERLKKEVSRLTKSAKRTEDWSNEVEKSKRGGPENNVSPDRGYIGHKSAKMMKRAKTIEARKNDRIAEKSSLLKNIETAGSLKIMPSVYHSSRLAELSSVSISYGDNTVCRNVSFSVSQGDRIAITGKNGSGKSSIIKLLSGEALSYTGTVTVGSRLSISTVSQDTSHLSGSLTEYATQFQIDESLFKTILRKLDFSRIQLDKDMSGFSGGQKKKVLIARSLCEKAHLYLWDEPLNYIDLLSRIQIEELLLTYQPTIVFVEHDNTFIKNIATKIIELN